MSKKIIPVSESITRWQKSAAFRKAYDALSEEFMLAEALIEARAKADMSQAQIARKMKTSQPAIARLEAGHGNPSLKTLQSYAAATGMRLKISFEPTELR